MSNLPVQREEKNCIQGGCCRKLAHTQARDSLCHWCVGWYTWWDSWSWRRIHFGSSFSGDGNPPSGAYINIIILVKGFSLCYLDNKLRTGELIHSYKD